MLILTLVKGIIVGLVIALPVGPVGVLCVRRTVFEGVSFGLVSGLGAATADSVFAIVAGFGLTIIRNWLLGYEDWLGTAGGLFLLALGARAWLATAPPEPEPLDGEALLGAYASSFALTIANPVTILMFAAIFAKLGAGADASVAGIGVLVAGVFAGSALWWIGIAIGLGRVRHRAGAFMLGRLNRLSGAVLLLSGAGLLAAAGLSLAGVRL